MNSVERGNVDFQTIEDWALRHGFEKTAEGVLSAPYADATVNIEFLKRDVRVYMQYGDNVVQRLITGHPSKFHIDENNLLQGAGLFTRFYTDYRDRYREDPNSAVMPIWFSEGVRAIIAEHVARERSKTP